VWLGVPLKINKKIIGVIAVQSYTNYSSFTRTDLKLLEFLSDQIAASINRKRIEEQIRKSEKNYRTLIETMNEGLAVVDDKDIIQFVNERFCNMTGHAEKELIAQSFAKFIPDHADKKLLREKRELRKAGIANQYEIRIRKKSGQKIWVLISGSPLVDDKGKYVGSVKILTDITAQKRAYKRVHLLLSAVDSISEGVILMDPNSLNQPISYANKAFTKITGYHIEEIKGKNIEILFGNITNKKVIKAIKTAVSKGELLHEEIISYKKNGGVFWNNINISPIFDEINGKLMTVFCTIQDVTKRKKTQEKLQKLSQQRLKRKIDQQKIRAAALIEGQEETSQKMARELHDGLGQMLTSLKLKIENFDDKSNKKNTINEIKNLLKDTITETKRISYNLAPTTLKDFGLVPALKILCEQNSKNAQTKIIFQNFGVKNRLDKKIERGLYRIAQEGLNNALKYADAKEINIQVLQANGTIRLMVEDDGKGFSPKRLLSATEVSKGRGNGLQNMQERANLLNGKIAIDSTPKKGTVIIVEMPLNQ